VLGSRLTQSALKASFSVQSKSCSHSLIYGKRYRAALALRNLFVIIPNSWTDQGDETVIVKDNKGASNIYDCMPMFGVLGIVVPRQRVSTRLTPCCRDKITSHVFPNYAR